MLVIVKLNTTFKVNIQLNVLQSVLACGPIRMAELYGDIRTVEEKTAEASEEQEEYRKRMDEMLTELEALKEEKKASEIRVKKIKDVISKMSKKEETTSDATEESAEVVEAVEEKSIKDENANEVTKTKGSKYKKDVEKLKNDLNRLKIINNDPDYVKLKIIFDKATMRIQQRLATVSKNQVTVYYLWKYVQGVPRHWTPGDLAKSQAPYEIRHLENIQVSSSYL